MQPQQMENKKAMQIQDSNSETENLASDVKYASNLYRYAASSLDGLITAILGFIFALILTSNEPETGGNLISLFSLIYSVLFVKLKNATPGKRFFGLEVRMEDGSSISWLRAILRETVGKILSVVVFMLGFIWILFDKRRQGWHDKLAKTIVIQVKEVGTFKRVVAWILVVAIPLLTLIVIVVMIVAFISIDPVSQIERINEAQKSGDIMQTEYLDQLDNAIDQN